MAFNDLLSTSFLFSIAIIIILIGGIFAYVSYRMSEQDHKITSMLGLISTMAEELQFFRSKLSDKFSRDALPSENPISENLSHSKHIISMLNPNNLVTKSVIPISLISVSDESNDDESNDDESNDDESNDDESNDDSSNDDESNDDESNDNESNHDCDLDEMVELEEADSLIQDVDVDVDIDELEELEELTNANIKSIHLEEPIDLNVSITEHFVNDLKTISITDLEDSNKKPDYKKLSLNRLREVVLEKGLISDNSKLKKNDLLKLLGEE